MAECAFYGGSFNPPTRAHEAIVDHLIGDDFFDEVLVKPCGLRADKPELKDSLEQRKSLVLSQLSRTASHYTLDVSAMSEPMCPTVEEWSLLSSATESNIWVVCGTDLFLDEGQGKCQIHRWVDGERLFSEGHFYIFPRPIKGEWLTPPYSKLVTNFEPMDISSSQLRAQAISKQNQP